MQDAADEDRGTGDENGTGFDADEKFRAVP